jgi:Zn-dependent protease with chaperone function
VQERQEAAGRGKAPARRVGALESTLPPRYKRQAWLAVVALLVFMGLYAALAGWFLHKAWKLSLGSGAPQFFGLVAAACAALIAAFMIKGVFFIRRGKPEGLVELRREEQPRLFEFLHQLADDAGAPRPHKVHVSARVNAAVFYDLSLVNLLLPSRKNLEIGLSLVNALTLGELRAVLAHEFGHFGQRAMAVGRWVYVAHQVTAQLVARRDKLDAFVDGLSRSDIRIAWVGWVLQTIVWAIRSLIDLAFAACCCWSRRCRARWNCRPTSWPSASPAATPWCMRCPSCARPTTASTAPSASRGASRRAAARWPTCSSCMRT